MEVFKTEQPRKKQPVPSGQPILNDNAAIVQNTNDIAFAVNQILGEGITDAEARIAQDFAATGGDNYLLSTPTPPT